MASAQKPQIVHKKSEHIRWRTNGAHKGKVTCMATRSVKAGGVSTPYVYTGGSDGSIKLWNGLTGEIMQSISGISNSAIICISFSNNMLYAGNSEGEVIRFDIEGRPRMKWKAHQQKVNCFQVVNQGRIFTGSADGTVKLFSEDAETLRQFPANPADCQEEILQLQIVPGNLIFTASAAGIIRVYNMRQDLLRVLRTSSLDGVAIRSMDVLCAQNKISVFCGNGTRLVAWFLTRTIDEFEDPGVQVDVVKAIDGRVGAGNITCLKPVFSNPLGTKEPTVYLGTSSGYVYLYVPTSKVETASQRGQWVEGQKFKSYTFKDAMAAITCLQVANGKVFAGTADGSFVMWNEPFNMQKLRTMVNRSSDVHPYVCSNPQQQRDIRPKTRPIATFSYQKNTQTNNSDNNNISNINNNNYSDNYSNNSSSSNESAQFSYASSPPAEPEIQFLSLVDNVPQDYTTEGALYNDDMNNNTSVTNNLLDLSFAPTPAYSNVEQNIVPPSAEQDLLSILHTSASELNSLPSPRQQQQQQQDILISFDQSYTQPASSRSDPSLQLIDFNQSSSTQNHSSYANDLLQLNSGPFQQQGTQSFMSPYPQQQQQASPYLTNSLQPSTLQPLSPLHPQAYNSVSNRPNSSPFLSSSQTAAQPATIQQLASANLMQFEQSFKPAAPEPEENRCVICLDKARNAALYQCGHACVCFECGQQLKARKQACPLCRKPIMDCLRLYH